MQVWARDPNRVRRGLLTPLSAACVLRKNAVGTWQITVDETSQWSPKVQPGWGVVVTEGDRTIFSGPVREIEVSQQGQTREVALTGVTDTFALSKHDVLPDPAAPMTAQTVSHYAAKGPAETLILDMIRAQAVTGLADRVVPGLVVPTSGGRGAVTSVQARFTKLLTEIQALATVGGLVFDVVQSGADLAVSIRVPADKSRSVRFMEGRGLGNYSTKITAPTVTTVILGAQGEGAAREIVSKSVPVGEWGHRIEVFEDRRDTSDADEHEKTMDEVLANGAASESATFEVSETGQLRFGEHFQLGDIVTVAFPRGDMVTAPVQFAEITWDEHGRTVELTVGPHSTDEPGTPPAIKNVRELQRALRGLVGRR